MLAAPCFAAAGGLAPSCLPFAAASLAAGTFTPAEPLSLPRGNTPPGTGCERDRCSVWGGLKPPRVNAAGVLDHRVVCPWARGQSGGARAALPQRRVPAPGTASEASSGVTTPVDQTSPHQISILQGWGTTQTGSFLFPLHMPIPSQLLSTPPSSISSHPATDLCSPNTQGEIAATLPLPPHHAAAFCGCYLASGTPARARPNISKVKR